MVSFLTRPVSNREQAFARACRLASAPFTAWKRLAKSAVPVGCMGLSFPNRLGIAAGFDRAGKLGRRAGNLGFGAIELGSWTRDSWPANHPAQYSNALLDARLGIRLAATMPDSIDHETRQLVRLVEKAWLTADYLTLAPDWLQQPVPFQQLHTNLVRLAEAQQALASQTRKFCPIVYKLRVRPGNQDVCNLVPYLASQGVDGILVSFDFGKPVTHAYYRQWHDSELQASTCRTIEACQRHIRGGPALLTNGGVLTRQNFLDRVSAGADLVQLHNALVFEGPDIGWRLNP